MSIASEWVKHQKARPTITCPCGYQESLIAKVTDDGSLGLYNGKNQIKLRPYEALRLASWIINIFDETGGYSRDKFDGLLDSMKYATFINEKKS